MRLPGQPKRERVVWLVRFCKLAIYAAYRVGKWLFLKISVETRELEEKNRIND